MKPEVLTGIFPDSSVRLSIFGAACIWAGFANALCQIPILVLLWPVALLWLAMRAKAPRRAFRNGWLCSFAGMFAAMYWLFLPVHNVGGLPLPAALLCAAAICAVLALQGALFALSAFFSLALPPFSLALALALSWYLLEYSFALVFGFPWLPLAGALSGWPVLVQTTDIFGAYALSAVWLFIVFGALFSFPFLPRKRFVFSRNVNFPLLSASIGLLLLVIIYGWHKLHPGQPPAGEDFTVLMVEGNIDQNTKWLPEFQKASLNTYMRLTDMGLDQYGKPALVIWPETALPFFYELNDKLRSELLAYAENIGVPLLFGAPGLEKGKNGSDDKIYNRAYLLNDRGRLSGSYDKVHLVPFGEYAPEWLKLDFLEALLQGVGIYNEGESAEPLLLNRLALGILICYEGIFPWLAQERVEAGANVIIDISNDGWFGKSPAPAQHLALTVLRCLEQGRWLVRATNTGISAIADTRGRIHLEGPMFRAGYLFGTASIATGNTFFHNYGLFFPLIAFLGIFFSYLPLLKRKREK